MFLHFSAEKNVGSNADEPACLASTGTDAAVAVGTAASAAATASTASIRNEGRIQFLLGVRSDGSVPMILIRTVARRQSDWPACGRPAGRQREGHAEGGNLASMNCSTSAIVR